MTAVLISMFLLVVGIAFLYFIERDSYLQLMADRQARSNYLARAGVEYFCYCKELAPVGQVNQSPEINGFNKPFVPNEIRTLTFNTGEVVNITCSASGVGCTSVGCILGDNNKVNARSTLVVPDNHPTTYLPVTGVGDAQLQ